MSWSRISAEDVRPQAWLNGKGRTRELLAWPHVHDWVLRVSVAVVEVDGPFSVFEGVDRWIAVLAGKGITLCGQTLRVGGGLMKFDGQLGPECQLVSGPTRDFNLMHRRGRGHLHVEPATHALVPTASWVGLFTAQGGLLEHGNRAMPLRPMTLIWCEMPAVQSCVFTGEGAAWWITWSEE